MPLVLMSFALTCAVTVLFYGASAAPAYAYLDPGTGSMILQVLLGGAAGLALAGKLYWHRFLTIIGVRSDAGVADEPDSKLAAGAKPRADN
jgi:hypothetical protein